MPLGTLDLMKIDGLPVTYQIMFEENAGGIFVVRIEEDDLLNFLLEEMRIDLPVASDAARRVQADGRYRMPKLFLEENNLHAAMEYMEEEA